MADLLPCPFCGSDDVANVSGNFAGPTNVWHAGDEIFAVNCRKCGASVPNRYRNDLVVDAWNRRPESRPTRLIRPTDGKISTADQMLAYGDAVRAEERERCAQIAEAWDHDKRIAAAIRDTPTSRPPSTSPAS